MIDLNSTILIIEKLVDDDTEASLTYAALECRLAIERICYDRLRVAHDYISHSDLKRWQPHEIVKTLIQEVDKHAAQTVTLSISKSPVSSEQMTREEYEAQEYVEIGTQIGLDIGKLRKLWNSLSNIALHIRIPSDKNDMVQKYGPRDEIKKKIIETIEEFKRIGKTTINTSGFGEEISFDCVCKITNKRRLGLLRNGQVIRCLNAACSESFIFEQQNNFFKRRLINIKCQSCKYEHVIQEKKLEEIRSDQNINFNCEGCGAKIIIKWRLMQAQKIEK